MDHAAARIAVRRIQFADLFLVGFFGFDFFFFGFSLGFGGFFGFVRRHIAVNHAAARVTETGVQFGNFTPERFFFFHNASPVRKSV